MKVIRHHNRKKKRYVITKNKHTVYIEINDCNFIAIVGSLVETNIAIEVPRFVYFHIRIDKATVELFPQNRISVAETHARSREIVECVALRTQNLGID